jgi:hypothetical protein
MISVFLVSTGVILVILFILYTQLRLDRSAKLYLKKEYSTKNI